jgi:hypothetical protein
MSFIRSLLLITLLSITALAGEDSPHYFPRLLVEIDQINALLADLEAPHPIDEVFYDANPEFEADFEKGLDAVYASQHELLLSRKAELERNIAKITAMVDNSQIAFPAQQQES